MLPRLTQNMVDAFGVTGHEGVYRRCCEVLPACENQALLCVRLRTPARIPSIAPAFDPGHGHLHTQPDPAKRSTTGTAHIAHIHAHVRISHPPTHPPARSLACPLQATLGVLRSNKDTILSVMDTFVHDPFVEWVRKQAAGGAESDKDNPHARDALLTLEGRTEAVCARAWGWGGRSCGYLFGVPDPHVPSGLQGLERSNVERLEMHADTHAPFSPPPPPTAPQAVSRARCSA
jgi:hypothetical protein